MKLYEQESDYQQLLRAYLKVVKLILSAIKLFIFTALGILDVQSHI